MIWAHIGIFASLIVGLFGGYWIKFLRWNDVDYIGIYSVDYQGIYDTNTIFASSKSENDLDFDVFEVSTLGACSNYILFRFYKSYFLALHFLENALICF